MSLMLGGAMLSGTAMAGDFQFDNGIEGNYKLTLNYGVGMRMVGSSRVDLQACKLEYSIVSPK